MPASVLAAARRARVMVVLASAAAQRSPSVWEEIDAFPNTARPLIPVRFDGVESTVTEAWRARFAGLPAVHERSDNLQSGSPSEGLVDRIVLVVGNQRQNARLRRVGVVATAVVVGIVLAAAFVANRQTRIASQERDLATRERSASDAARRRASAAEEGSQASLLAARAFEADARDASAKAQASATQAAEQARWAAARQLASLAESIAADSPTGGRGDSGRYRIHASPPTDHGDRVLRRGLSMLRKTGATLSHPNNVTAVRFSADGERLATVASDGSVRVFNAVTGVERFRVQDAEDIEAIAFSPDGRSIAAGSDKSVRIVDAFTGREHYRVPMTSPGRDVIFSQDGTLVAGGTASFFLPSAEDEVRVWSARTGAITAEVKGIQIVNALALSLMARRSRSPAAHVAGPSPRARFVSSTQGLGATSRSFRIRERCCLWASVLTVRTWPLEVGIKRSACGTRPMASRFRRSRMVHGSPTWLTTRTERLLSLEASAPPLCTWRVGKCTALSRASMSTTSPSAPTENGSASEARMERRGSCRLRACERHFASTIQMPSGHWRLNPRGTVIATASKSGTVKVMFLHDAAILRREVSRRISVYGTLSAVAMNEAFCNIVMAIQQDPNFGPFLAAFSEGQTGSKCCSSTRVPILALALSAHRGGSEPAHTVVRYRSTEVTGTKRQFSNRRQWVGAGSRLQSRRKVVGDHSR